MAPVTTTKTKSYSKRKMRGTEDVSSMAIHKLVEKKLAVSPQSFKNSVSFLLTEVAKITDGLNRDHAKRYILDGLLAIGEFQRALEIAKGFEKPHWQNLAFIAVIEALLKANKRDEAREVAGLINESYPYWKTKALILIAENLAESKDSGELGLLITEIGRSFKQIHP